MARKTSCKAAPCPRISGTVLVSSRRTIMVLRLGDGPAHQIYGLIDVEGLRQVFESAALECRATAESRSE
jgi:hypothetical protein